MFRVEFAMACCRPDVRDFWKATICVTVDLVAVMASAGSQFVDRTSRVAHLASTSPAGLLSPQHHKNSREQTMAATAKMTEDEHAKEISAGWQNQLY